MGTNRTATRAFVLTFAVCALMLSIAPVASAGQAPPYGSTTTTAGESFNTACELSPQSGTPGTQVTATVTGAAVGDQIRILFNGREVGRGAAERGSGSSGTAVIPFTVPATEDATYTIVAVGATFTEPCGSETGGFLVEGATVERGSGSGRGLLPRTGIELALWLALAVALLLAGRVIAGAAKERRRRAHRSALSRNRSRTTV